MYIDTHVHCRDFKESHKETIERALYVAEKTGATAIVALPNTKPSLITEETVEDYLALAKQANSPVKFYVWAGVTMNFEKGKKQYQTDQLRRAIALVRTHPQVVGLKMYASHSVGDLAIVNSHCQQMVYRILAEEGYDGVMMVHCEDEEINRKNKNEWKSHKPWTWNNARPKESELESIRDQIGYKAKHDAPVKLHIAHVTTSEAVDLIEMFPEVTCEATFQHLLLNTEWMKKKNGIYLKCNPPVREKQLADQNLGYLIYCIGSDHTPHTKEEKLKKHMSGVTALHFWARGIKYLREVLGVEEERLHKFIFENPRELLGLDIEPRKVSLDNQVLTSQFGQKIYGFDPFPNVNLISP